MYTIGFEGIFLTIMLPYYFLQDFYVEMWWVLSCSRSSMIASLNAYIFYLSTVSTKHLMGSILLTILLAYLFILVISIHDYLPLSFIQHLMLAYIQENVIYISTYTIKNTDKLTSLTILLTYWFLYEICNWKFTWDTSNMQY